MITTDGLNQHKVFLDIANGHINTKIFSDMVNSQIGIEDIFGQMLVSSDYSGATSLAQITLDFTIIVMLNVVMLSVVAPFVRIINSGFTRMKYLAKGQNK